MKKVSNSCLGKLVGLVFLTFFLLSSSFKGNCINTKNGLSFFCKTKDNFEGTYSLNSCENGRFKIKIENKEGVYFYNILDQSKIIAKGKVKILKENSSTYLIFGKIEGMFDKKCIKIQNYGNSMNEYAHFTQCEEKYLSFEKK